MFANLGMPGKKITYFRMNYKAQCGLSEVCVCVKRKNKIFGDRSYHPKKVNHHALILSSQLG